MPRSRKRSRAWHTKNKRRIKMYVLKYLLEHPCVACPEADIRTLEFHHRDDTQKLFNIGGSWGRRNFAAIKKEIAKCDVLCASCHKKIHNVVIKQLDIIVPSMKAGWSL